MEPMFHKISHKKYFNKTQHFLGALCSYCTCTSSSNVRMNSPKSHNLFSSMKITLRATGLVRRRQMANKFVIILIVWVWMGNVYLRYFCKARRKKSAHSCAKTKSLIENVTTVLDGFSLCCPSAHLVIINAIYSSATNNRFLFFKKLWVLKLQI